MKTSTVTLGIAVVAIAALVYLMLQMQWFTIPFTPAATENVATTTEEVVDTTPTQGTGTLKSVLTRGGNYTCTIQFTDPKVKSTASIFASNGKIREDYRTVDAASGKITDTHSIKTGGTVYIWVDGATQGVKTVATAGGSPTIPSLTGGGFVGDEDSTVGWDCHAWLPNQSFFTVPTTIKFVQQ